MVGVFDIHTISGAVFRLASKDGGGLAARWQLSQIQSGAPRPDLDIGYLTLGTSLRCHILEVVVGVGAVFIVEAPADDRPAVYGSARRVTSPVAAIRRVTTGGTG
jgi:hypothetical protein